MYDNFFTIYEATEPPPIKRRTDSKDKNDSEEKLINDLIDYSILSTSDDLDKNDLDEPNIFSDSDDLNLFTFQTDELPEITQLPNNSLANRVVNLARSFVGGKYIYGGSSPKQGFDCSGLISWAYKLNNINLGRSTYEIFKAGKEVKLSDAKIGDIICTPGSGKSGRHVKMISKIDDEGIHVIEARGKDDGIVEDLLTNTSNIITIRRIIDDNLLVAPTKINGKFSNKLSFILSLTSSYRRALLNNDMDPDWAPMLVTSASIESDWGASPSGSYNYGGVKVTDAQIKNGVSYTTRSTVDYIPGQGNKRRDLPFRNFKSVDDYCNYMVKWLKSSGRYGNIFNKYSANLPMQAWENILRAGYGGGSDSNIKKYMEWMKSRYNSIKQA